MGKVVDLVARLAAANAPDADCVRQDQDGRPLYRYALEYRMGDASWSAELWAYSFDDAEQRVAAMRDSLVVLGQLKAVIGP